MVKVRVPTLDELLARIDDWQTMTGPELAAAVGAEEARDVLAQFAAKVDGEDANPKN